MSLCLCKVCIIPALSDDAPGLFMYSAILSLTAVSCEYSVDRIQFFIFQLSIMTNHLNKFQSRHKYIKERNARQVSNHCYYIFFKYI